MTDNQPSPPQSDPSFSHEPTAKRPYQTPRLHRYGTIESLTHMAGGSTI